MMRARVAAGLAAAALAGSVVAAVGAGAGPASAHDGSASAHDGSARQDAFAAARAATAQYHDITKATGFTELDDAAGIACIDNPAGGHGRALRGRLAAELGARPGAARGPGLRAAGRRVDEARGAGVRHPRLGLEGPRRAGAVRAVVRVPARPGRGEPEPVRPAGVLGAAPVGVEREPAGHLRRLEPEGHMRERLSGRATPPRVARGRSFVGLQTGSIAPSTGHAQRPVVMVQRWFGGTAEWQTSDCLMSRVSGMPGQGYIVKGVVW